MTMATIMMVAVPTTLTKTTTVAITVATMINIVVMAITVTMTTIMAVTIATTMTKTAVMAITIVSTMTKTYGDCYGYYYELDYYRGDYFYDCYCGYGYDNDCYYDYDHLCCWVSFSFVFSISRLFLFYCLLRLDGYLFLHYILFIFLSSFPLCLSQHSPCLLVYANAIFCRP